MSSASVVSSTSEGKILSSDVDKFIHRILQQKKKIDLKLSNEEKARTNEKKIKFPDWKSIFNNKYSVCMTFVSKKCSF